jgi:hypothetical protein
MMFQKDDRNLLVRFGDVLHDYTRAIVYNTLYPLFSVVRAGWQAVKDSWADAA